MDRPYWSRVLRPRSHSAVTEKRFPHPVIMALREVFGRRHPAATSQRSHLSDLRHAAGHIRAWLRTDAQREELKRRHRGRVL